MTLRILWNSDRMTGHSAYSKITSEACQRLQNLGHQVAHVPMGRANNMGKYVAPGGVMIYPSGLSSWNEDVAVQHYLDWKADMIICLKEPWVYRTLHREAINFVPMAIIDHQPVSGSITSRLQTAFRVIAVSRFGQRELRRKRIESTYIPHSVRSDLFKPLPEEERQRIRKLFFFDPDEYVVLVVAMNRARKMVPRMLRGYKRFIELNPDVKTHLMLWSNVRASTTPEETPAGVADVGVALLPEIMDLGLGEAVRWPEQRVIKQGIPDYAGPKYPDEWDMVKLYNSADCILHCTGGEGFGLPLIEAQACGKPVVATDYTAMPEHVGAGLTVKADDYVVISTPGTRYHLADIDGMAEAMTKIMNADPEKLQKRARGFAERYSWHRVIEKYWKPFLEEMETELRPLATAKGVRAW